jgi:DNA-binding NtrC family response regulator
MAVDAKRYLFLVDDEPIQNEMLKDYLAERFLFELRIFENGEDALSQLHQKPEIVILDYHLNGQSRDAKNGVEVLRAIKEAQPDTQVIMLSGQDKLEVAVESMRYGAYDYVVKGETAFNRVENAIINVSELNKALTINQAYRRTILLLSIGIGVIALIALYLAFFTDAYSH